MLNENLAYAAYRAYCWKANVRPASREEFATIFAEGAERNHEEANYDHRVPEIAEFLAEYATR